MAYLLFYLINGISTGANAIDEAKTKLAVQSLVANIIEQNTALVTDNAKWDDAVTHVYGNPDPQWLLETWGSPTSDQNYDSALIVDETGKTIAMFTEGQAQTLDPHKFFGPEFQKLLDALPKDNESYVTSVGFLNTQKGIAVVSAAPILPYTEGKKIPSSVTRKLVFGKTLTPEYISKLGQRLQVQNLEIVPASTGEDFLIPLRGGNGVAVGHVSWTPDRPGDKAKAAIQGPALVAISAMIACMLLLTFVSSRLSSGLQKSERIAWRTANTDALTLLPNRNATNASLQSHLSNLKAGKIKGLAVILADLDGFKDVNDTYGHQIGDQLLQSVSAGLTEISHRFDASLSRLGGDEFAFVLVGADAEQRSKAISVAMLDFFADPMSIEGRIAKVGMSIGIAAMNEAETRESELLRRADVAMYVAKERGKNQFCVYDATLEASRNNRIKMAQELRHVLTSRTLQVAYQPIVNASSGQITCVEALARWQTEDGSWVPPDQFISVAEEFGLIDELGNQVLDIACRQAASWNGVSLSVNVSPVQFRNPHFVQNLTRIVNDSGLPRHLVELEVTESYIIEHSERAKSIIDNLHDHGFLVALDDFGSGYSGIGYLMTFCFDKLKIDRSIVHEMLLSAGARNIILATVSLAHSMNMLVTAEGVEGEEEVKLLRLAGCDSLQGYYFGRPEMAEATSKLLDGTSPKRSVA